MSRLSVVAAGGRAGGRLSRCWVGQRSGPLRPVRAEPRLPHLDTHLVSSGYRAHRGRGSLLADTFGTWMLRRAKVLVPPRRCDAASCSRVQEAACEIFREGRLRSVGYARQFPSPRTERVSPGHLVAVATATDGSEVVVWRWHDAVVLGEEAGLTRLWEPAHGEVVAQRRRAQQQRPPGTRAYLSAACPGRTGGWPGAVAARAEDADVELDEVRAFLRRTRPLERSGLRFESGVPIRDR